MAKTKGKAIGTDLRIDPDDVIEAVGTGEPRSKVVAEELVNPVEKRIYAGLIAHTGVTKLVPMNSK